MCYRPKQRNGHGNVPDCVHRLGQHGPLIRRLRGRAGGRRDVSTATHLRVEGRYMTGARQGDRPVDGTARSRAHGGAMRSAWPWPDQGTETTTGDNSEGAKHANTEAVALSAVPCRSYQSVGMEASQLFQNWPQYGAASATLPSNAFFYFFYYFLFLPIQRGQRTRDTEARGGGGQVRSIVVKAKSPNVRVAAKERRRRRHSWLLFFPGVYLERRDRVKIRTAMIDTRITRS